MLRKRGKRVNRYIDTKTTTFPENFVWGVATSSFQIEGAVDRDGRGESIWDRFGKVPGKIDNGDTGDVACSHYDRYRDDVQLMKELSVQSYRFSVSWPRIFPEGKGRPNQKGMDFYKSLVDQLLQAGITPMLTCYHWDLPQALQERGGWLNRDTIDRFLEYVTHLYRELGDVVPSWITHNEPWVVSYLGYGNGIHAPGIQDFSSSLKAAHHLLLSHGKAVSAFRQLGPKDGEIGISLNLTSSYPADDSEECRDAARKWDGFINRWYLDPLFKGKYPADMVDYYAAGGWFGPDTPEEEMDAISQPIDFLGINYYSRATLRPGDSGDPACLGVEHVSTGRPVTAMGWEIDPQGLYDLLKRLRRDYGETPIIITENGAAFEDQRKEDDTIQDESRVRYIHDHLKACHRALADQVPLKGYYAWSFMDNFEWAFGYQKRFGLVHVDYETQKRTPKNSAWWYKQVMENNGV
ncbi:GH1 family beta-glucosidase [Desmospora profundinema]|uniref:GH1 family beta-glucosidase n=1 Tax=Desmospora profundinema TaxID=1571184 RepID=UPI00286AFCAC|nr:GH1 family beta-glucosidase [Desmospora profundinema]